MFRQRGLKVRHKQNPVCFADGIEWIANFLHRLRRITICSQIFPVSEVYTRSAFNTFSAGKREAFVAERDQPFVIFYQTERPPNATGVSSGTEKGVVVWVVPEPTGFD